MERSLFRFIYRFSRKEQLLLLVLTFLSFPFLYYSLDLPKTIINRAIGGRDFPKDFFGYELEQLPYLFALCGVFLALVLVNGAFKYAINVYRGVVGERMLRRLRYQLFHQVLRFPLPHFRRMSQGEIVSMITGETEQLGGFIGDSVVQPAFQGGTLLTILAFMFVQDWKLGTAAIALYPLQMYVIPLLQRRVNALRKERVLKIRKLSERIGEVVGGVRDIHALDTTAYELADYTERMGEIFRIRFQLYRWKFLIKFLNNFLAQLTPFFFFSIGGWLVIRGDLTFGALVAVLAAYKDLSSPWKEILDYYQEQADARIKYDLLVETFEPPDLLDEAILESVPESVPPLLGPFVANNLSLRETADEHAFETTLSLRFPLPQRVALVGSAGAGADRLAAAVVGLLRAATGSLSLNGVDVTTAPESVIGRRISYVSADPYLYAGTLADNLYYGLKHRPLGTRDDEGETQRRRRLESIRAGNSRYDIRDDWLDFELAGASDMASLNACVLRALRIADMEADVYQLGLRGTIEPEQHPALAGRVLEAREALRDRLQQGEYAQLVEVFDDTRYNTNMTVAENLMFGTPSDPSFDLDNLAAHPYVRKVLYEAGVMDDFLEVGRQLAALMVDLFADVPADSELFEQFSFISADDLPDFRTLLSRLEGGRASELDAADRIRLLSLPFKLIPARHRLGLLDENLQNRLLEARRLFARGFAEGRPAVEFFDPATYTRSLSIQDNILFGRLVYGRARATAVIGDLIRETVDQLGLHDDIVTVGLQAPAGVGGTRLAAGQRIKLALARAVLKRPDVLVVDRATATLDPISQRRILASVLDEFRERGLIWVLHHASLASEFDHTVVMQGGSVVAQGPFEELDRPGSPLRALLDEG